MKPSYQTMLSILTFTAVTQAEGDRLKECWFFTLSYYFEIFSVNYNKKGNTDSFKKQTLAEWVGRERIQERHHTCVQSQVCYYICMTYGTWPIFSSSVKRDQIKHWDINFEKKSELITWPKANWSLSSLRFWNLQEFPQDLPWTKHYVGQWGIQW